MYFIKKIKKRNVNIYTKFPSGKIKNAIYYKYISLFYNFNYNNYLSYRVFSLLFLF